MQGATAGDFDHAPDRDAATEIPALHALLRISDAVLRAHYFDEVLEVIAEQARAALDATTLSICRLEQDLAALRILHNSGALAADEQRWPQDDLYEITPDSSINTKLAKGISYANAVEDDGCPEESRQLLTQLGKESELAVPVMIGESMWGTLWATGTNGRRFGDSDILLLQAIAAQTAVAIGRSELLTTVWRYAFEDPLTGIANRRALDRHLDQINWGTEYPVALVCDLDGFKRINDRDGHPAGDQILRSVASGLSRLTNTIDGAVAARLGGDEFCVLLPDATLAAAQVFAMDATKAIRATLDSDVTMSWGAAAVGRDIRSGDQLIAAADAALREAKRQGPARFSTGVTTSVVQGGIDSRDRNAIKPPGAEDLPGIMVRILDHQKGLAIPAALEILALQVQQVIGTAAWSISECGENHDSLRSVRSVDAVFRPDSGLSVLTELGPPVYSLKDYPATARAVREGTWFVAATGLEGSDPAETALLGRLGYKAVLGVGVPAGQTCYLIEFFSHDGYQQLFDIAPMAQVLATYCVSRLSESRPHHRRA